jgi:putative hydrolase of the HAD superfamily
VDWKIFIEMYLKSKKQVKDILSGSAASHNRYLYIQKTLENFGLDFSPILIYEATNIYWDYVNKNESLFPGVIETLDFLRKHHIKVTVVTDLTADIQNMKLIELGIDKYINYLVTSEEAGSDKPDPRMLQLAVEKMAVSKDQIVIVGNNPKTDIQAAKNFGSKSVLFDYYSKYSDEDRNSPTHYITQMSELLDILEADSSTEYSDDMLLVFDLVGTLTTETHVISNTLADMLPGVSVSKIKSLYDLYKINKITNEEFWSGLDVKSKKLEKEFLDKIVLKRGIKKVLKKLKRYYKLAILSNFPKEWGVYLTDKLQLDNYFDEIIFSGDYGVKKPHPLIYRYLLDKFSDISPDKVLFVDDDLQDLESGKNYLMKTVWLRSDQKDSSYIPNYVISRISDILKLVESIK